MPGIMGRKMGQKVDLDFTLRKVFGKETFRYGPDITSFTTLN
jgi:bloom syndrome protein